MMAPLLTCPLCSQPGFQTLDSLRYGLISAATREVVCPVCHDVLSGLDKFTIHLFSHTMQQQQLDTSAFHKPAPVSHHTNRFLICDQTYFSTKNLQIREVDAPMKAHVTVLPAEVMPQETIKPYTKPNKSPIEHLPPRVEVQVTTDIQPTFPVEAGESAKIQKQAGELCKNRKVTGYQPYNISTGPQHITHQTVSVQCPSSSPLLATSTDDTAQKKTEVSVRCSICGFSFNDESILAIHKQLVHTLQTSGSADSNSNEQGKVGSNERSQFPCHLCSKVFKMRGSLMVHLRVAHSSITILGKPLASRADIVDSEERKYNCHLCTKSFKKEQHLTQHVKTHDGKQWECETCCKLFTTKYFLKKHRRLHTGETPYSCEHCGKTFTFQQSYHKHLLYHSDDKPHVCTECDRAFKELSTLHNHQRIHTGEKPFACETCGKCFRQRVSYLVHRRIHTGAMPYQCTACGKRFRYKVSQRTHKCPAQPPGTVVRQSGESVLKEDIASQANVGSSDGVSVTKTVTVPIASQQIPAAHQQLNNNQFAIIVDNNAVSMLPTSQMVVASTGLYSLAQGENRDRCEALNMKVGAAETVSQTGGVKVSKLSTEGIPTTSSSVTERDQQEFAHKKCSKKPNSDTGFVLEEQSGSPELWRSTIRTPKSQDLCVETTDFFTMVMSPSLRSLPSPSERLKHLTLSSPGDTLLTYEDGGMYQFLLNPEEGAKNPAETSAKKSPKQSSENIAADSASLQTINEESFKQLLYGGSRP